MATRIELVQPHQTEETAQLRAMIGAQMDRLYSGWSDDYDRRFDERILWFTLKREGRVRAITRLMFPDQASSLPMQQADRSPFSALGDEPYCEGSGLYFRSRVDIALLFYNIAHWMCAHRVPCCYASYDAANETVRKLYTESFGFNEVPSHDGLVYESFINKRTQRPAVWKPVVLSHIPQTIDEYHRQHGPLERLPMASVDLKREYNWWN